MCGFTSGWAQRRRATVEVHWPSGVVQELGEIAADRYVTVREK